MSVYEDLEKRFSGIYLIEDKGIIKLLCATVIANRLPVDPVWLFIVAPSGGGKTELINTLSKVTGIYPLSSVTAHTFISGQKKTGMETSLLYIIKEGIITFKDFTSILSLQKDERAQIIGQLREIYDGSYSKSFGTGETLKWKGKIGLIAGVTTAIYVMREIYANMGERFLMYAPLMPDRVSIAKRAMENTDNIREARANLQEIFAHYLDQVIGVPTNLENMPPLSFKLREELLELAEFATRARSPVERNHFGATREISFIHPPEVPTRFASQLKSIATSLMLMNDPQELSPLDEKILYKLAFDSIGLLRRQCLEQLAGYRHVETAGVAVKMSYPTPTTRYALEELTALQMVDRIKGKGQDKWSLKTKYRTLMEKYESIKMLDMTLTEDSVEAADAATEEWPDLATEESDIETLL